MNSVRPRSTACLNCPDLGRVRGIQNQELGEAAFAPERPPQDGRRQAGAAHPEQDGVTESRFGDLLLEGEQRRQVVELRSHDGKPTDPAQLVAPVPKRRIAGEESARSARGLPGHELRPSSSEKAAGSRYDCLLMRATFASRQRRSSAASTLSNAS